MVEIADLHIGAVLHGAEESRNLAAVVVDLASSSFHLSYFLAFDNSLFHGYLIFYTEVLMRTGAIKG